MPIAYDATRLFLGPLSWTPRGIDRVDLEYARHVFTQSDDDCYAILPTIWGIRCFPRERVLRGLPRLEELWSETIAPEEDRAWLHLKARLQGHANQSIHRRPSRSPLVLAARMTSLLKATGIGLGHSAVATLPRGTAYLNIGQIGLSMPFLLRWLDRRPDIRSIFMLHDVIPLETPEYVEPSAVTGHAAMVEQTARRASGLVVTTQAARAAVQAQLEKRGAGQLATLALPLPVQDIFRRPASPEPDLADISYFVVCGAIEHRKNHLLLMEVWRRLARRLGPQTPHLVAVGSLGWQGGAIRDKFERSTDVNRYVHLVSGLSTPALHRLIGGARALLMPSLIEGYGLPIVEAGAMGTPVIASDISAHREVASPATVFVDPLDGPGWEAAILEKLRVGTAFASEQGFEVLTWPDYFVALGAFIDEVKAAAGR